MPHMEYSFGVLVPNIYYVFSLQIFNTFNLSYLCQQITSEYLFGIFKILLVTAIRDHSLLNLRQTVTIWQKQ